MRAWQFVERGMFAPKVYDTGDAVAAAQIIAAINERDANPNDPVVTGSSLEGMSPVSFLPRSI